MVTNFMYFNYKTDINIVINLTYKIL